jgi:hypothetical protein
LNKQQNFEDSIKMESELTDGDDKFNLDRLPGGYKVIWEVINDIDDSDIRNRRRLISYINYKFSKLTDIQKQIAEYRYYYGYKLNKIAKIMCKDVSTIHYHIEKIRKIW